MQPRVIAVLAARNGAAYLERTVAALRSSTRLADVLIAVDAGSSDDSPRLLSTAGASQVVGAPERRSFGQAIAQAVRAAAPPPQDDDWFWLLGHDNAPEPEALARLLAAVEVAPSVAVAGPKLMRWDDPAVITAFGETVTRFGTTIPLVEDELDQAQHDVQADVLGVSAGGMLVRRSAWAALGGFDPGLPAADAGLDFSIRARLAGHRVIVVPGAKVASAGPPELFIRDAPPGRAGAARLRRSAQLHRRLVYSRLALLPLHWLSLLPLAVLRSIVHLIAKRPWAVPGEFTTALAAMFSFRSIGAARRNLRRGRRVGWNAITGLRMPWPEVRERRAQQREAAAVRAALDDTPVVGFVAGGGLWTVFGVALASLALFGTLLAAKALIGGGLLPLSNTVGELWSHIGYSWRDIGAGFTAPADPFGYVLAVLGSLTFWSPSLSIVVLHLAAMPLAALAAWFCARRFTVRGWLPALAAVLWAVAPPFLAALAAGQLGGVLTHLLLPWLILACIAASSGVRSWSATATAALLGAAIAAASPVLVPALLVCWLFWLATRPRRLHRLLLVPLPAAALFAPLVVAQAMRGTPLALLADPVAPSPIDSASGWQLALGSATGELNGWPRLLSSMGLDPALAGVLLAALLVPLGLLAVLGLFVLRARRAVASLAVALLGYATAVLAGQLQLSSIGSATTSVWSGAGLSLFWMGLIGMAFVGLDALRGVAVAPALIAGAACCLAVAPLLAATWLGSSEVRASTGRILPAVVSAQADSDPGIGTLILSPQPDGALATELQRGYGTALDEQSTLDATSTSFSAADARLARLAANLASRGGYDPSADLEHFRIGFVVLDEAADSDASRAVARRTVTALDSNAAFVPVGSASTGGSLWRARELPTAVAPGSSGPGAATLESTILTGQAVVFGVVVLLALPTQRRRRSIIGGPVEAEEPVGTFDEEEHD